MSTVREIIEQHPETRWAYADDLYTDDEDGGGVTGWAPVNMYDLAFKDEAIYEPGRGIFLIGEDGIPHGFPLLAELPTSGGMTDDERAQILRDRAEKREASYRRYADARDRAEAILVDIILEERWVNENLSTVIAAAALVVANSNR